MPIKSTQQAKFLRKVYLTSVLIRHFRGWNRVTEKGQRLILRADKASRLRDRDRAHRALQWWAARARKKRLIARQWINGGMWLRLRVKTRQVVKMFVVLRYVKRCRAFVNVFETRNRARAMLFGHFLRFCFFSYRRCSWFLFVDLFRYQARARENAYQKPVALESSGMPSSFTMCLSVQTDRGFTV